ncbi:MAG: hydantoinase B/oxoprolinase family protein [Gammaproteobacteria bacterium]|nr:hydantoinase B/oxoprolinase family protein [Gammaproteobacteria bacterium]
MAINTIQLSLFTHKINALCEEMGAQLRHAAFSPNIRDRLDYSCAMFDSYGQLCAQAAHIPVHLGSMAYAMESIVSIFDWQPGDIVIFNDPYLGGTHLPDVTLVSPVYVAKQCIGFVANRAHHADIGSDEPGSMPLSSSLIHEGIVISPQYLGRDNQIDKNAYLKIFAGVQQKDNTYADLSAQLGANLHGVKRIQTLVDELDVNQYKLLIEHVFDYAQTMAVMQLKRIPNGNYSAVDYMDDDGLGNTDIVIKVNVMVDDGNIQVDFSGTEKQVQGNINCPKAVTAAAVFYVFRCLMTDDVPSCKGTFNSISIETALGSLVDAKYPAAVAAGNVETSSRIVDVLFAALAQAFPSEIPAASQGTMNNIAMGCQGETSWSYYETIGGGAGATANYPGLDAVQTHMTNTQNTPIEVLEMNYPLRINRYEIRKASGGHGQHNGGCGIVREFEFLQPARVTILSERRMYAPYGLNNGEPGKSGKNFLNDQCVDGKVSMTVQVGDKVRLETPGGGAYGVFDSSTEN